MIKLHEFLIKVKFLSLLNCLRRYTADLTRSYETYIAAQKEQLTEAARLLFLSRERLLKLEAENLELKDDLASIYARTHGVNYSFSSAFGFDYYD